MLKLKRWAYRLAPTMLAIVALVIAAGASNDGG